MLFHVVCGSNHTPSKDVDFSTLMGQFSILLTALCEVAREQDDLFSQCDCTAFQHLGIALGNLSYNRKTVIQSSHVQHSFPPKPYSANFDDFKILSSCSETYQLMIHESLLISKLKPSVNVKGSSIPVNLL